MILTCEGEVFFATHSIESYLGFHQVRFHLSYFLRAHFSLCSTQNCPNFLLLVFHKALVANSIEFIGRVISE